MRKITLEKKGITTSPYPLISQRKSSFGIDLSYSRVNICEKCSKAVKRPEADIGQKMLSQDAKEFLQGKVDKYKYFLDQYVAVILLSER